MLQYGSITSGFGRDLHEDIPLTVIFLEPLVHPELMFARTSNLYLESDVRLYVHNWYVLVRSFLIYIRQSSHIHSAYSTLDPVIPAFLGHHELLLLIAI